LHAHGQSGAQHLVGFLAGQVSYEIFEERQPVHLREQHVDREADTELLADLTETRLQQTRRARNGFRSALLRESLRVHTDQRRAGSCRG